MLSTRKCGVTMYHRVMFGGRQSESQNCSRVGGRQLRTAAGPSESRRTDGLHLRQCLCANYDYLGNNRKEDSLWNLGACSHERQMCIT